MELDERLFLRIGNPLYIAFGEDGFRSDAVHPDAVGADLGGEVLREDLNTGLGGGVGDGRCRVRPGSLFA